MLRLFALGLSILLPIGLLLCPGNVAFSQDAQKSPTELNPQAFEHFVNGDLYELSKDFSSAIQEYEKAKVLEPDVTEIRYALARAYLMMKDAEAAKREALQIEPKDGKVYRLLGDSYRATGAADSATEAYTKAVGLDSTDLNSLWYLAMLWQQKRDVGKAIHYWTKLASLQPFSGRIHLQLAALLHQNRQYDEAISEYTKVLDLDPHNDKALEGLGKTHEAKGDLGEAILSFRRLLELKPHDQVLTDKIIALYLRTGEPKKATELAEGSEFYSSDDPLAQKRLGVLYLSLEDYDRAESLFMEYIRSHPGDARVHFLLGSIALQREELEKAKTEFEAAVSWEDSVPDSWINLALIYLRQDSTKKAIQVYRQALEKVNDKVGLWFLLGSAYAQDGQFDSALVVLRKASDKNPHDTRILFALGSAYERSGDFDRGVATFERLLRIDSTHANALNYLGYMLADKGIRLEESLEMIRKALAYEPENGAYLDSYAWVLYRLGELKEAEIQIKKALEVTGDDPIIHEHLGDIYDTLGETQKAKDAWEQALQLDQDNEKLKEKVQRAK
ncbi:MAG: tetratricopeptide repeat protein [Candidatus Zixiibacteriota bacterium]|nr:MAG: tetratricopeptide repeat protein [candidate division Zixibacteria bacterium]